jgi:hypothetical protein
LEWLDLSHTRITDAGAVALAAGPRLAGLRVLDLSGTDVTEAGRELLKGRFGDRVRFE